MSRLRKEYKNLTIKLEKNIAIRLEEYCEEVGQTKTMAIERILGAFFDKKDNKTTNLKV